MAATAGTSVVTLAMAVVVAAVGLPAGVASAAPVGVPGVRADNGASVVTETVLGPRTVDLVVNSPAVGRDVNVRLLLPPSYFTQPDRVFPTLYLLHGCCEPYDYQSWTQFTDVEEFMADKEALVVMPTDDNAGMYTDWLNWGRGKPGWETFHTVELLQLLERGYRAGPNRAVAGISIGGLGAFKYAANH
nr:alpha/beta hydrolase-fold protein [Micromonospora sp. DSM 115978]